jgi:anti-anti-sigma factor
MQALDQQTEIGFLERTGTLFGRFAGDITIFNSDAVRTDIRSAWDERGDVDCVLLDLRDVRHLDSSGVGMLLELASHARESGISLRLCHLRESPHRILDRTGLASLFEIYGSVEEAIHIPHIKKENSDERKF